MTTSEIIYILCTGGLPSTDRQQPSNLCDENRKISANGQRWVNELTEFHFSLRYNPEVDNKIADFLSRNPLDLSKAPETFPLMDSLYVVKKLSKRSVSSPLLS